MILCHITWAIFGWVFWLRLLPLLLNPIESTPPLPPFYTQLPALCGPSIICHCSIRRSSLLHCRHSALSCRHYSVQASSAKFTPPLLPLYTQLPLLWRSYIAATFRSDGVNSFSITAILLPVVVTVRSKHHLPLFDLMEFTPPLPSFYTQLPLLFGPGLLPLFDLTEFTHPLPSFYT